MSKVYWINTVSLEHVQTGVKGGFTQADHGKATTLNKLSRGDLIVFYSPRTRIRGGEPLQKFTAVGRITDTEPYQVAMPPAFHPWRRNVEYLPGDQVSIRPLIEKLEFISDKRQWGYPFRRGLFQVERADFEIIAKAMNTELMTIR